MSRSRLATDLPAEKQLAMARRQLLTVDEHARLFGMPSDPETLIRHGTLSPVDLDWLAGRRGAANRLGAAVQLCLLRHPGFGLRAEENPPESLLAWLARQLDVPAAAWADYAQRDQTRREHARASALRLGLRAFTRADLPFALSLAEAAAWSEDWGAPIAAAIMAGLREARIIPSSPRMIERLGLAGRARAQEGGGHADRYPDADAARAARRLAHQRFSAPLVTAGLAARHPGGRRGVEPRRRARPARSCPGGRSRSRARHHHP
jgi:hypothetical protein